MRSLSIRQALPILIIAPLITAVGLAGWVAFRGARQSVNELMQQLADEVGDQLEYQITNYLHKSQVANRTIAATNRSQLTDLNNFSALERYFWILTQQSKESVYPYYGDAQGNFIGVQRYADGTTIARIRDSSTAPQRKTYRLNAQGKRTDVLETDTFDPRGRDWYQTAVRAGQATWSPVYIGISGDILVAAVAPVYQGNSLFQGQLKGVLGSDISLNQISDYLRAIKISPASQLFIIERSGELIATSADESPVDTSGTIGRRISAQNSREPIIRETAQFLSKQFGDLSKITAGKPLSFLYRGQKQFVEIQPVKDNYGLDWLLIAVLPESDFMQQVYAQTRFSLLLGLLLVFLSALLGVLLARWLSHPLQILVTAAKDIQNQKFDAASLQAVTVRSDEIGQLARVFDEMATVIFSREQSLQSQLKTIQGERDRARQSIGATGANEKLYIQQLLNKSRQIRGATERQKLQLPELLRTVTYFEQLNDTERQQLYEVGYKKNVSEGEYICRENETGDALYIILSGAVEVYIEHLQKYLRQLVEGDFFGELSLLLGMPWSTTVKALEDSVLFAIDRKGFQAFLQKNPAITSEIAKKIELYTAEISQRKEALKKAGILENEEDFNQSPLNWIQKRMKTLFGI